MRNETYNYNYPNHLVNLNAVLYSDIGTKNSYREPLLTTWSCSKDVVGVASSKDQVRPVPTMTATTAVEKTVPALETSHANCTQEHNSSIRMRNLEQYKRKQ